jgi:hypothetical protein
MPENNNSTWLIEDTQKKEDAIPLGNVPII